MYKAWAPRMCLALAYMLLIAAAVTRSEQPTKSAAQSGQPAKPPQLEQRGTESAPIVVKVLPAPKTDAEIAQDASDRKERAETDNRKWLLDKKLVDFNGELAYYTLILAVVGIVQFLVLLAQAFFIPMGFKQSRRAGDIAREAMITSNRAYVHYDGCEWISHRQITDGRVFWKIHVKWSNAGNTPTRALSVLMRWELREQPLPVNFDFEGGMETLGPLATIAPKGTIRMLFAVNGADLAAIRNGTKHLYVWGRALYRDVFQDTPQRVTRFCVVATDITGDPEQEWNDQGNRVGIIFSSYGAHNCADEECSSLTFGST